MRKLFIFLSVFSFAILLSGKEITLSPENILIFSGKKTWQEAQDLAYHFELITGRKNKVEVKDISEEGKNFKGKYIFRFVYTDTEEAKKRKVYRKDRGKRDRTGRKKRCCLLVFTEGSFHKMGTPR